MQTKTCEGMCTPWEYLGSISMSLKGNISLGDSEVVYISEDSSEKDDEESDCKTIFQSLCGVSLNTRDFTW